ncbi:MAG TPA: hypothetical protein VN823_10005, partial [Stellaceae bacterium]|nr:hypothetical protein [Stellaceae bacterium]
TPADFRRMACAMVVLLRTFRSLRERTVIGGSRARMRATQEPPANIPGSPRVNAETAGFSGPATEI